ncbi:DUF6427 family protein [Desertivirga arenae]|uniref:DUF6427 family protein n=1 Tax=Desertivirga arenae TaxID=2810309 RepID=UPI001A97A756|nr:DUF6427 family protein [Pedobacter sp. SYSU D00823]
MIDFFRRLNPVSLLIIIIIAAFLRVGVLLQLPEHLEFTLLETYAGTLLSIPSGELFSPSANLFFATIITISQAVIFNRIVNNYNLLGKPSFLPGLMYVTVSSLLVPFVVLSPALLCNFLMLWLFSKFLVIYRKEEARSVMYDSGMIIGLGTLIYFPFIGMIPMLWIALIIFRPFEWREWASGIIGFFTIYFFLAAAYYLNDSFQQFAQLKVPLAAAFPSLFKLNIYDYIVLAPVLVVLVLSVYTLQTKLNRSSVHIRKSYLIVFIQAIFSILSFYIKSEYHAYHFILTVAPISLFMAHYFMYAGKRWLYESMYLILLGFIIYFQFV